MVASHLLVQMSRERSSQQRTHLDVGAPTLSYCIHLLGQGHPFPLQQLKVKGMSITLGFCWRILFWVREKDHMHIPLHQRPGYLAGDAVQQRLEYESMFTLVTPYLVKPSLVPTNSSSFRTRTVNLQDRRFEPD